MDELLIRRAGAGDSDAFEALMRGEMESLVWRVCWHYTGNREDAADCGQAAMLKIWKSLPSFRFDCAFESWVWRIAASCCLDFLRKRKRDRSSSLEPLRDQGFDPPDPSPGPEEHALRREREAALRHALALLPVEQRDALMLTQLEGKPYAEAAAWLGVTEGTVKSRVNRARARLKDLLREGGELSSPVRVKKGEGRVRS